jgi:hypothetical protein
MAQLFFFLQRSKNEKEQVSDCGSYFVIVPNFIQRPKSKNKL